MYLENVFCSFQVGLACRRRQIYFVISKAHEYHALSDLSFFGRGLLAESVNKDTMVKLTLSLNNLWTSLLSRFVELGSTKTHNTPQPSVAMSLSTILSLPCAWVLREVAESKHKRRTQTALKALKEHVLQEPVRWSPFWFCTSEISFRERKLWGNPSPTWSLFPSMFCFLCPLLTG